MVLLPGCGCCSKTCLQLFLELQNASSVEVTVNASDYLRTQKGTYTACPPVCGKAAGDEFGTTQLFPGSEYAGSFALAKVTQGIWRYTYSTSGLRCGNGYLEAKMGPSNNVYAFSLAMVYRSLSHCDMAAVNYISKSGFDCTTQYYTCSGSAPNNFAQAIARQADGGVVQFSTTCSNGSFDIPGTTDAMLATVVNPCVVGDVKCPTGSATFATQSEAGSLNVTFSNISFVA